MREGRRVEELQGGGGGEEGLCGGMVSKGWSEEGGFAHPLARRHRGGWRFEGLEAGGIGSQTFSLVPRYFRADGAF